MTTTPTEATITTLTAEVRTLVVGARQVTLSVYRQLDRVPLEDMQPMGRVNDSSAPHLAVIGRGNNGSLVRAWVAGAHETPRGVCAPEDAAHLIALHAAARALPLIVLAGLR